MVQPTKHRDGIKRRCSQCGFRVTLSPIASIWICPECKLEQEVTARSLRDRVRAVRAENKPESETRAT